MAQVARSPGDIKFSSRPSFPMEAAVPKFFMDTVSAEHSRTQSRMNTVPDGHLLEAVYQDELFRGI